MALQMVLLGKGAGATGDRAGAGFFFGMTGNVPLQVLQQGESQVAAFCRAQERRAPVMDSLVLVQALGVGKEFAATFHRADMNALAQVLEPVPLHPVLDEKTLRAAGFRAQVQLVDVLHPVMVPHGACLAEAAGAVLCWADVQFYPGMGAMMAVSVGGLGKASVATFKKAHPGPFSGVGIAVEFQGGVCFCPVSAAGHRAAVYPAAAARPWRWIQVRAGWWR